MKRFLSGFTVLMCIWTFLCGVQLNDVFADNSVDSVTDDNTKVVTLQKFARGQDVEYCADIVIEDLVKPKVDERNGEFYKIIIIRNTFSLSDTQKCISESKAYVNFGYDGKNVKIHDGGPLIIPLFNDNKNFKVSSSEETYSSFDQSIVSQSFSVYKRKTAIDNWKKFDEFHLDVICTPDGQIGFNIKSFEDDQEKKVLTGINETKLKNGMQREVTEYDIKYSDNSDSIYNNDHYDYITREIHVLYKDKDGDVAAYSIIRANFRYNKDTYEVKCLSTSHEEKIGKEKIKVKMRTGNETRTYAGAYGKLKLERIMGIDCNDNLFIKCTSNGSVISQFT